MKSQILALKTEAMLKIHCFIDYMSMQTAKAELTKQLTHI